MINKRLLIKNLLAYSSENTFFDKKRLIDFETREGKSKFLKHICALSNANPHNNSYLLIGVEDEDNTIVGVDFFDDSKIQNIVNAYLENPPKILYENILFPHLKANKVVGLVTISPDEHTSSFKKNIGLIPTKTVYNRVGSISMPQQGSYTTKKENTTIVKSIENSSQNRIKDTLDGVISFIKDKHPTIESEYIVFKEIYVLCWAGVKKTVKDTVYYSRVDIELINEQVKLFYSALDEVSISYTENTFEIIEYISAKIKSNRDYFPFEKVCITFDDKGRYMIERKLLFESPSYDNRLLTDLYTKYLRLSNLIKADGVLLLEEIESLKNMASTLLICHLQNYTDALTTLLDLHHFLKSNDAHHILPSVKGALRILRKLKYEVVG